MLGLEHVIAFLLQHFWLLYPALLVFSATELITGVLTRLSATLTVSFSVLLMLLFGWQSATCIDEWTQTRLPEPQTNLAGKPPV